MVKICGVFEIPPLLDFIPDMMGKPIDALKHTLDCTFIDLNEDELPSVFMRIIWSLLS